MRTVIIARPHAVLVLSSTIASPRPRLSSLTNIYIQICSLTSDLAELNDGKIYQEQPHDAVLGLEHALRPRCQEPGRLVVVKNTLRPKNHT